MGKIIYDHLGNPVDTGRLREQQATPTVTGVRPLLSDHPSRGLNPGKLARVLLNAEDGDATAYLELAEDMEEKDPHYLAVLGTRKRAVSQLDITVTPASESKDDRHNADLVERFLDREVLEDELFDLLDAIGKGYSVLEIIWDTTGNEWLPSELVWRDPRWFSFDKKDGRTLLLKDDNSLVPLYPYSFLVHMPKAKSGLAIRGGLARPVSWYWMFKSYGIRDWVTFSEVYGQPIRVGKYGGSATEAQKEVLLKALRMIGTDAAAMIPESMQLEFVKTAVGGSSDMYESKSDWFDRQVTMAVLGQTGTTELKGAGSYAAANVHDSVRNDIRRADLAQLRATLNQQLVVPIVAFNRGPQKAYPKIKIGLPNDVAPMDAVKAVKTMVDMGARIGVKDLTDRFGFSVPDDDDEIFTPAKKGTKADDDKPTEKASHAAQGADPDGDGGDGLDGLSDFLDDFTEIDNPILTQAMQAVAESDSYDDLKSRLNALSGGSAIDEKTRKSLEQAIFTAFLAGEVDADLSR